MPRKKEEQEAPEALEEVEQAAAPKNDASRKERWAAFLEKARAQNPVKFAAKEENGEFKEIPASFK